MSTLTLPIIRAIGQSKPTAEAGRAIVASLLKSQSFPLAGTGPRAARIKSFPFTTTGQISGARLISAEHGGTVGFPGTPPIVGNLPPLSRGPGGFTSILWEVGQQLLKKFGSGGAPGPALAAHSGSQAGEPVGDVFGFPDVIEGMIKGTLPRGARQIQLGPNGMPECPQGFHFHKGHQRWCVHNRRMNPLNQRALSRAGRRVGGFARAVKRARALKRVCKSL